MEEFLRLSPFIGRGIITIPGEKIPVGKTVISIIFHGINSKDYGLTTQVSPDWKTSSNVPSPESFCASAS